MSITSKVDYLLDYTEWDRSQWEQWFRAQQPAVFAIGLGANCDGRITNVGELVRHIFSAEQRFVERIRELPLSDTSTVPTNEVDAMFALGRQSRQKLRQLLDSYPSDGWDVVREIQIGPYKRPVTPKTMVVQALTHEIRHWAQLAMLLRIEGLKTGPHDFILSGVFEGQLDGKPG